MILWKLFLAFAKIGASAFGGGYAFLPLIEREAVQYHQWLDKQEFLDVVGISTAFPGALSIKLATYTGYKVAGIPGAIVANIGNILPPVLLILTVSWIYTKYKDASTVKAALSMIQYAVFAMLIAIAVQLVDTKHVFEPKHIIVVIASFLLFTMTKIHPAFIIIGMGLLGAIIA